MKNPKVPSVFGKILSITLVLIAIGSIGAFTYNIAVPPVTEKFTEFYVLNSEGKATGYPQNLDAGKEAKVILGIVNQEQKTVSYRMEVRINQVKVNEAGPVVLEQGETHQEMITFQPASAGDNQKVEFLLYQSGQSEVYQSVYILVNVK